MSIQDLNRIREEIDTLDDELVGLLKKRLSLVEKAASAKKDSALSAYSKEREHYVIDCAERKGEENSLPKGLMSDIMRRILRESYRLCQNTDFAYPKTQKGDEDVVIVGGNGGMGRLFSRYYKASGYTVHSFGHSGWDRAEEYLKNARVVIVSVPIDITVEVIKRLSPLLREDQILCDYTSVKKPIVEAMLRYHKGPVLGLHPMFGPDVKNLVKQVIVTVPARGESESADVVEQMRVWGARICRCEAQEHDDAMRIIQALRHFSTYAYGSFLSDLNPDLKKLIELSSPIYSLELLMVGRLFAQDARLYGDIIMSSKANCELIEKYVKTLNEELKVIQKGDLDEFTRRFMQARDYFGDFAQNSLSASASLLQKLQDERE